MVTVNEVAVRNRADEFLAAARNLGHSEDPELIALGREIALEARGMKEVAEIFTVKGLKAVDAYISAVQQERSNIMNELAHGDPLYWMPPAYQRLKNRARGITPRLNGMRSARELLA